MNMLFENISTFGSQEAHREKFRKCVDIHERLLFPVLLVSLCNLRYSKTLSMLSENRVHVKLFKIHAK